MGTRATSKPQIPAPKTYLSTQNIPQHPHPKVMAETEGYSPGGDAELYISATLALLLGLMGSALGIANLFGNLLGPKGKIFIFEMDQVMGELLGIPNYSKLEAVLLLLGAVGAFLCWSSEATISLVSILGLLIGTVYMGVCLSYGVNAHQPLGPFLVPLVYNLGVLVWRCLSFLRPEHRVTVVVFGVVGLLLTLVAHLLMRSRREKLQKFEAQMNAKNVPVVWQKGKDFPDGFEEAN